VRHAELPRDGDAAVVAQADQQLGEGPVVEGVRVADRHGDRIGLGCLKENYLELDRVEW
jgi:hypothetical protein